MKNINLPSELYQFASEKFSFLLDLGFEKNSKNAETCFASSWLELCLINERFETCPQDITFFLPEQTKTPSLYIALQYYMDDYWDARRRAEEKSRETDADRRQIDVSCKMLASNSWLLVNPQWLKAPEFLSACTQLERWFQRGLSAGNFPSAEEATRYLQSLKKG